MTPVILVLAASFALPAMPGHPETSHRDVCVPECTEAEEQLAVLPQELKGGGRGEGWGGGCMGGQGFGGDLDSIFC